MPKITDEEFKEWLNCSDSIKLIKSDKHNADVLVKIPYKQDFDLLFCSHVWDADNLKLNEKLENAGLYYRKDGCIYNSSYSLKNRSVLMNRTLVRLSILTKMNLNLPLSNYMAVKN